MKPIDAVSGLPRSPDVARIANEGVRQAEAVVQNQAASFSRVIEQRSRTVNESGKPSRAEVNSDSGGGGSGPFYEGRHERKSGNPKQAESVHPSKGKILDIRGN